MAMITPVLRPDSGATKPLYLRIAHNGTTRYLSLQRKVAPSDWNEEQRRFKGKSAEVRRKNERLMRVRHKAEAAVERALPASCKGLKQAIARAVRGTSPELFSSWCREELRRRKEAGQLNTYRAFRCALRRLEGFTEEEGMGVAFRDVTVSLLRRFKSHLQAEGLAENTVGTYLRHLQTMWNQAKEEGETDRAPFDSIQKPQARTEKTPLTATQVRRLREASFEEERLRHTRDFFLFALYAGGMRWGDVCTLRPENIRNEHISYRMRKNGKQVSVPLLGPHREMLGRYDAAGWLLPILQVPPSAPENEVAGEIQRTISMYNYRLSVIADSMGWDRPLSTHIARHTFASLADQNGQRLRWIQDALAHSSPDTTMNYLQSIRQDELDEGMGDTFEGLT